MALPASGTKLTLGFSKAKRLPINVLALFLGENFGRETSDRYMGPSISSVRSAPLPEGAAVVVVDAESGLRQ